jgi:hypothetical protein
MRKTPLIVLRSRSNSFYSGNGLRGTQLLPHRASLNFTEYSRRVSVRNVGDYRGITCQLIGDSGVKFSERGILAILVESFDEQALLTPHESVNEVMAVKYVIHLIDDGWNVAEEFLEINRHDFSPE